MNKINSCRICGSNEVVYVCNYSPYSDYAVDIYDCASCKSRFTTRDSQIYERLHKSHDLYLEHQKYSSSLLKFYKTMDTESLRRELTKIPKNKFVIESIDKYLKRGCRVLELGCSSGHLSSYAISKGFDFIGCDISETAISKAKSLFPEGDFRIVENDVLPEGNFDFIYHVGTIGCVESPIELTKNLLSKLNTGGHLVFNAPNRSSVDRFKVPWVRGTTPPDLVTLFDTSFWTMFNDDAFSASTKIVKGPYYSAPAYIIQRFINEPDRGSLFVASSTNKSNDANTKAIKKKLIKKLLNWFGEIFPLECADDDFGLFISVTRLE